MRATILRHYFSARISRDDAWLFAEMLFSRQYVGPMLIPRRRRPRCATTAAGCRQRSLISKITAAAPGDRRAYALIIR